MTPDPGRRPSPACPSARGGEAATGVAAPLSPGGAALVARREPTLGTFRPWLAAVIRWLFRPIFRGLFRMRVRGRAYLPAHGPVILAGNHSSVLDGPLVFLFSSRTARFLAKEEVYSSALPARALGWLGQIPVRRGQPDRAALRSALAVLAGGEVIGVFPEGSRGGGAVESVHPGVAYLAIKSGAPVVPVACVGTAAALPKGRWWPRWGATVEVHFGPAFRVALTGDPRARRTVADAADQIRVRLRAHVETVAGSTGRPPPQEDIR